ncbi:MAG: BTAD domain-containing putative transcriptional regulator [Burkholderiaceae bacterium]
MAALLWPDVDADNARNNLRQRVFRLRRLGGRDVVEHRQILALAPGILHDLGDLEDALRADAAGAAGELLGQFDYADSAGLADWIDAARQRWRAARRDLLAELAAREEQHNRIAAALPYAERLARDEPLLEHAQRQLMRLHYRRGDRGAALEV